MARKLGMMPRMRLVCGARSLSLCVCGLGASGAACGEDCCGDCCGALPSLLQSFELEEAAAGTDSAPSLDWTVALEPPVSRVCVMPACQAVVGVIAACCAARERL